MNREQRRAEGKEKLVLANLLAVMANGNVIPLDIKKVSLVDTATGKPLFKPQEKK